MNIRFLGTHNLESEATSCISLLIDHTLALDAGGLTSHLSITEQVKLEAILLTHHHYDHIRDIPGLALNLALRSSSVKVYSTATALGIMEEHLLNGKVYPQFQSLPPDRPTLSFNPISPYEPAHIDGHDILAVPVRHYVETVGYQVSDHLGKTVFYTSDTGPGLADCWQHISPQLLIIDVSLPNAYEKFAGETGHLTPELLQQELASFRDIKGYLPQVAAVHMDAGLEQQIKEELEAVARALKIKISVAREGMQIDL